MKITAVEFTGPHQVGLAEDTLPEPGKEEIEVHSLYSAISHGTEMNVYRGDAPMWTMEYDYSGTGLFLPAETPHWQYPIRYGYACVGEVTRIGAGVTTLQEGDIVFSYAPHQTAHVMAEQSAIKLPSDIDPLVGIFLANLSTTFTSILDADLHLQECVVVFGQGVLGQLVVQYAKLAGAEPVIAVDLLEKRLQLAKSISGADMTFNPVDTPDIALAVRQLTDNRGADVVFEVSASDLALHEAIRTACYNGKVIALSWYPGAASNVYLGREFHHNRIQLICSQSAKVKPELSHRWGGSRRMQAAAALLPRLRLKELITDVVDFRNAADAYEVIANRPDDILQIAFKY